MSTRTPSLFLPSADRQLGDRYQLLELLLDKTRSIITVSFRGTEIGAKDLSSDLYIELVATEQDPSVKLVGGFMRAYESVTRVVHEFVGKAIAELKAASNLKALYVTGHSLGGALAAIAVGDIHGFLFNERHVDLGSSLRMYSFGAPPVGNLKFQADFDTAKAHYGWVVERVVVDTDPVPTGFGVLREQWGYYNIIDTGALLVPYASDSVGIYAHPMSNYIERINHYSPLDGDTIQLIAENGQYLKRFHEKIGKTPANPIVCYQEKPDAFSNFLVKAEDDGKIALMAENGVWLKRYYIDHQYIAADAARIDLFAKFYPIIVSGGRVSFVSENLTFWKRYFMGGEKSYILTLGSELDAFGIFTMRRKVG